MADTEFSRYPIGNLISKEIIDQWDEVAREDVCIGDCVLFRRGTVCAHVGFYAGQNRVIHTEGPDLSVLDRLDSPLLSRRIAGFYRLKGL